MRGGDQVRLSVYLLNAAQQETPQAACLLDLAIHRFDDRLALGIDLGTLFAAKLARHAGFGVGALGKRAVFRRQ